MAMGNQPIRKRLTVLSVIDKRKSKYAQPFSLLLAAWATESNPSGTGGSRGYSQQFRVQTMSLVLA